MEYPHSTGADPAPDTQPQEPAMTASSSRSEDSTAAFATDLRALRLSASNPTLFRLQHATGISKTVLSDAFSGRRLPSARTVDGIVRACGGAPAEWLARRDALARGRAAEAAKPADAPRVASVVPTGVPRRRSRNVLLIAMAFVLGVAVSAAASYFVTTDAIAQARADAAEQTRQEILAAPASEHAQINVRNGADPALTACVNDAKVATSQMRLEHYQLEIIWSNKCYAGWGRVTRFDEKLSGNTVTVSIYPETAATGPDRQTATEPNVQGAYTTLVVRPTEGTRLCTVGSVTIDGENVDLGEPLCI
ncbi:DUF2690 domain-containing protein [Microbacterium sp. ARD32]|uniref:DUF2690 domain-containing protein n=1 Tax=Microbacterium sp. ARD32 TaxID=2962577 RepID=UPI00288253E2|nr:DUF2690 domain-containing protein [Microbacterium sp. ARD32]MDT0158204.1 DUF2690 domain-containing protein [Microbacterium sp. ARD32]